MMKRYGIGIALLVAMTFVVGCVQKVPEPGSAQMGDAKTTSEKCHDKKCKLNRTNGIYLE